MAKTKTTKTREVQTDAGLSGLKVKSTNPKIMSEQIQRLNKMIKSVDTAGEISYDNTTSGLTATNVQAALDEVAPGLTAEGTSYDNTNSGLTADDVQSAIDEVITTLGDLLLVKELTHAVDIASGVTGYWNVTADTGYDETGYTPIGIVGFYSPDSHLVPVNLKAVDSAYAITLRNVGTASASGDFKYQVLYVKNFS